MNIGEIIKERREELGMSQEELAIKLGYKSRSSINKIERDGRGLPQKKIKAIADALLTTPAHIMGWDKEESVTEEIKKDNDTISNIIVRMRIDSDFLSVVESIYTLDGEKLQGVKLMLNAFLK